MYTFLQSRAKRTHAIARDLYRWGPIVWLHDDSRLRHCNLSPKNVYPLSLMANQPRLAVSSRSNNYTSSNWVTHLGTLTPIKLETINFEKSLFNSTKGHVSSSTTIGWLNFVVRFHVCAHCFHLAWETEENHIPVGCSITLAYIVLLL
jgi:hypothetical protein